MQAPESYYHYLINRYFNNSITRYELDELLALVQSGQNEEELTAALLQQWEAAQAERKDTGIDWDSKLEAMLKERRSSVVVEAPASRRRVWYRIAAAAVLLLFMGAGIYYTLRFRSNEVVSASKDNSFSTDSISLKPGVDGAVLTLADGRKIVLDSAGHGLLAMQGNTKVLNHNGSIRYDEANANSTETIYNTLTTPRGKQFKVILSDGTKVWLNAASSIRFPATFSNGIRRVEITGEAYFEVAHRDFTASGGVTKRVPFIVTIPPRAKGDAGAEVQVLGTHFNINAYEDEAAVRTTLLEGSVSVKSKAGGRQQEKPVVLQPGEQAVLAAHLPLTKHQLPDTDAVIAWRNGYFSFSETDMATMMRQIARWYDVDIEYAGAIPDRKFGGEISRNSNAEEVLKIMEESEVHFKIAGRKIIVLP